MKPAPIYAWVTVMADGRPSIVGAYMPQMSAHLPLVGFNRAHIAQFASIAKSHGEALGQPVYFVEFGAMEILEESRAN